MGLTHKMMMEGVFHICDGRDNYATLLVGSEKAILFDTMAGYEDLKSYVEQLTPLKPILINSHSHFDHMGGNHQFDHAYMTQPEIDLLDLGLERLPVLEETLHTDMTDISRSFTQREKISPIEDGTVFDLGGMTVEVVLLPGHTPGCIGLLCRELRLLLAGDSLSPQLCLLFRESLPLETYRETMAKLWTLPFDRFLSSHFDFLYPKEIMHRFEACFDLIGKKRAMKYTFPPLPDEHGLFYILTPRDPEIGQLIGIVVKRPEDEQPQT
ncbi:MAG: MBL fold metallo-hydrolase [Oscillospiraceae bacterium]|nr:MBL fold metallo-hydrolase [Oscillospiraceae bacterium]